MKKIITLLMLVSLVSFFNLNIQKCRAEEITKIKLKSISVTKDQFKSQENKKLQGFSTYDNTTARKYVLGPNDVINLSFIGFPDFRQDNIHIQPDGKLLIAPVGSIKAEGMTIDELQQELTLKFGTIIKNPMISVNLVKPKSLMVYITGAVTSPGSYELNTDTSVSNAYVTDEKTTVVERKSPLLTNVLVAAGGITPDADIENIEISNKYDNTKYKINLLELINKGNSTQDICLINGDSVYIPKSASTLAIDTKKYSAFAASTFSQKQIPVRVLGYVNHAGLVMLDTKVSPRLNTAISEAGGYPTGYSSPPKNVIISRMDNNGKFTSAKINPMKEDVVLLPNDVIYVPEKTSSQVGRAFDYLLRIVSPVSSVATGYSNMDWAIHNK